jgi:hypothetical protein
MYRHLLFALPALSMFCGYRSVAQTAAPANSYVITQVGDTLRGPLELSRFVSEGGIKLTVNGEVRPMNVADCRGFATADGRRYVRRQVSFAVPQFASPRSAAKNGPTDSTTVFLQELVAGKARLYRLDYRLGPERTPLDYAEYDNTFFYVQAPGSTLFLLQPSSYREMLAGVFADCPAVQPVLRKARFDAKGLAAPVLQYNTNCATGFAAAQLLQLEPQSTKARYAFGLRAGVQWGSISYPDGYYAVNFANPAAGTGVHATVGVSLLVQGTGRWNLGSGLFYTARNTKSSTTQVVNNSFANKGETLNLAQEVSVKTIQIPLLAQYRLSGADSGIRPYLGLGVVPGVSFGTTSRQSVLTSTLQPGNFVPSQTTTMVDSRLGNNRPAPMLGFQASAGGRPQFGKQAFVAELYAEIGRELTGNSLDGKMTYQGVGIRVGVDF